MRKPALILGAVLMRPVDAAHAEDRRLETITARVIEHILIGSALRAAIWAVKLQRPGLVDPGARDIAGRHIASPGRLELYVVDRAVNLVGRGEDHTSLAASPAQRFEQGERAERI